MSLKSRRSWFGPVESIGLGLRLLCAVVLAVVFAVHGFGFPAGLLVLVATCIVLLSIFYLLTLKVKKSLLEIRAQRSKNRQHSDSA